MVVVDKQEGVERRRVDLERLLGRGRGLRECFAGTVLKAATWIHQSPFQGGGHSLMQFRGLVLRLIDLMPHDKLVS